MRIFEEPWVLIVLFALCAVSLAALGIYFAVKGIKTVEGRDKKVFIPIAKMESSFKSVAESRVDRSVVYISISLADFFNAYSQGDVFDDMERIFLKIFSIDEDVSVSRYSDKSYVVFAKYDLKHVRQLVDDCRAELNHCLQQHSAVNAVEIRFGSCFASGAQVTFDEAIERAKQACVLAKNEKIPYAEWDASSGKDLQQKINIENNIEKEIDSNRFFLEYQPVLDAKTRQIVGAEVLSRLNSESDGVLMPRNFLEAVDSCGLNEKFDCYIFEKNCKWISNNKKQREAYQYTVNFSRSTLSEPSFVEKVIGIAEKYDLSLSCLAVEVLEDKDVSGDAKKQMMENLTQLKEKGVVVLLDDFGSGYTTFGDLQDLDVSVVKVDRVITQNAVTDTGFIILKNIISTAKDIGFKTLCEGIETKEQEEMVIKAGCDLLQGFYYYRPMPVSMLEKLLDQQSDENK